MMFHIVALFQSELVCGSYGSWLSSILCKELATTRLSADRQTRSGSILMLTSDSILSRGFCLCTFFSATPLMLSVV